MIIHNKWAKMGMTIVFQNNIYGRFAEYKITQLNK